MGRSAAGAPDPHRPCPRHQRAHLDHRPHHRHRAAPPHHDRRARQRVPQQIRIRGRQARAADDREYESVEEPVGELAEDTRELWWHTYPQLTRPAAGPAGYLTARAEAHTIRLALLYALLDGQRHIQPQHLQAALALWDYAARSAAWALERAAGDPLAHQIHDALTHAFPDGLTRTQLRDLLHRNPTTAQLDQALAALAHDRKITSRRVLTNGRPAELWTAIHN